MNTQTIDPGRHARRRPHLRGAIHQALAIGCLCLGLSVLTATPNALSQEHSAEKNEAKEKKPVLPSTLSGLWAGALENQQALHKTLATKKLEDVHHFAFAIRDHVAAMPAKSASLPKDKRDALTKSVARVTSLAKFLDEAGDAGDSAKVATHIGKLDAELKSIEALYPASALKSAESKTATPAKVSSETGKMSDSTHAREHEGAVHVFACPMHSDVVSDKPGKCAKCGMDLVEKKG